jgi:hypothetical protein
VLDTRHQPSLTYVGIVDAGVIVTVTTGKSHELIFRGHAVTIPRDSELGTRGIEFGATECNGEL